MRERSDRAEVREWGSEIRLEGVHFGFGRGSEGLDGIDLEGEARPRCCRGRVPFFSGSGTRTRLGRCAVDSHPGSLLPRSAYAVGYHLPRAAFFAAFFHRLTVSLRPRAADFGGRK